MPKPPVESSPAGVPAGNARTGDEASQTARAFVGMRELLMRGEFARGERISELGLAARLGMSRTPIRLALERLAHIGLLEAAANGGFVLREFTTAEVFDAIELRGVLEGTAARLAAERLAHESELEPLRRGCTEMEQLERLTMESFARYMDLNEAFHAHVLDLAKSDMLRRSLVQVNSLPFASPSAMVFPASTLRRSDENLPISLGHHRGILQAIATRQGTRAEALAREHARIARRMCELALASAEGLSRVPGGLLINVFGC